MEGNFCPLFDYREKETMANITKKKRDQMIAFLETLKIQHNDDASVRAFNEIENHLKEKKFGLVFEEHTEEVDELLKENIPVLCADSERRLCIDDEYPWNFLIEGDNLQALYLLEKTHYGKIDCIYIDPPYNTGAKDWKYNNNYVDENDTYRHSKWLSMMNQRLRIARKLLKNSGIIVLTIDDYEIENITMLMNEIFGEGRHLGTIIIRNNPQGRSSVNGFQISHEYALFYGGPDAEIGRLPRNEQQISRYNNIDEQGPFEWRNFRAQYSQESASMVYPIYVKKDCSDFRIPKLIWNEKDAKYEILEGPNSDEVISWPIAEDGRMRTWKWSISTLLKEKDNNTGVRFDRTGTPSVYYKGRMKDEGMKPYTIWDKPQYSASTFGANILSEVIGKKKFNYPKSLYAVIDCLKVANTHKNAVVLDFFAGSGTTLNAINLMNAEDGGKRKCIIVTNNEVSEKEEKRLRSLGLTKADKEWDELGIAKSVTWKRSVNTILGNDIKGEKLTGEYLTSQKAFISVNRNFHFIDYINIMDLNLSQKKNMITLLTRGIIPKSLIKQDSKYIVSENEKYTISILFDDEYMDDWITNIEQHKHIQEFYIFSKSLEKFNEAKVRIQNLLGDMLIEKDLSRPMSEGFTCNLKYFKCDWTPRKPEDYLLSNALCLHIKEMIELQNSIEVDGEKNILILNKDDIKRNILDKEKYEKIETIWLNENIILNNEEIYLLKKKGYKYIPREFFGQELRAAAE